MHFQNYVYTVVNKGSNISFGTFPNFKKAYERIEKFEKGSSIIDCGSEYDDEVHFQVIKINKGCIYTKEYVVYRNLLTIYEDDQLVSTNMVYKLTEENETRSGNSKYALTMEVL